MPACRVCATSIEPFMSFGKMPIANGFLAEDEFPEEYFFEMEVAFCETCGTFQLVEQPDARRMFHENYAFFSSLSKNMQVHFKQFAEFIMSRFLEDRDDPFVVELGSNDGIMLRHFKQGNYRHLGVEPSENVADVARSKGIQTISEFFSLELAKKIVAEHGHADALICANVMCHIPTINDIAAGISELLTSDGVLVFEEPYLGDMLTRTSYDQIYDEHVFVFSAHSVSYAFGRHGLELIDLIPQTTHGGSMRYVLAPVGSHTVSPIVAEIIEKERDQGLHLAQTFERFKENCESSRTALVELLTRLKDANKRVVGYGATSKSTTVLNYCGIGPDLIDYISDTTPIKQGKFTPGTHIPVKPHDAFEQDHPEYALLFAWNHATEIFEKEEAFSSEGGKWIYFVPKVKVVE
ncbi:MAG: class I SAM-dependent methyltransferase [Gammaproteobacteria bacterium]|nr:class I SAM-dependent methyltransferase [Gammaproteobacteria bacterium]